jgi:peptidyl-prolyl cis-trans isomerase C
MNAARLTVASLALVALAACNKAPEAPKEDVVATIDGKALSRNTFEQYVAGVASKPVKDLSIAQRDEILDSLVRASVVAAEAERNGTAAKPEVAGTLEIQRLTILERSAAQDFLKDKTPSEEELQAEYALRVQEMDKTQFRVSHIQVDSQAAAKTLLDQAAKGQNFENLARQNSLDANSREQGGDLQWAGQSNMPPAIAQAITGLKKGEVAKEPVQTEFGWHVLKVTDVRDAAPPPFESVREQVVQAVNQKKFKAYTDSLMTKAKVTKTP